MTVFAVKHALQGHPESSKMWIKIIDKILIQQLGLSRGPSINKSCTKYCRTQTRLLTYFLKKYNFNNRTCTVLSFHKIQNTANQIKLPYFCAQGIHCLVIKISLQIKLYPNFFYKCTKLLIFCAFVEGIMVQ